MTMLLVVVRKALAISLSQNQVLKIARRYKTRLATIIWKRYKHRHGL